MKNVQTQSKSRISKVLAIPSVATGLILTAPAHADVSAFFTSAATDLGGVETGVMSILGILATVVAVLIGWAYFKRVK